MALDAFLRLAGAQQGQVQGSVTRKGQEGAIRVVAVRHSLARPRDPGSGQPTGLRHHGPYVVTKELDAASAPLLAAWTANEVFATWELRFFSPSQALGGHGGAGAQVNDWIVRLTDATVASIDFTMPDLTDSAVAARPETETVSFFYASIEWTWTKGPTVVSDFWSSAIT